MQVIKKLIKKHNEKILSKNGFIHCASCKEMIKKSDKYCLYCGNPTGTKPF